MEGTNKRKLSIMLVVILLMQIILPVLTEISCLQESLAVDTMISEDQYMYKNSYGDHPIKNENGIKTGAATSVGKEFYYKGIKYKVTKEADTSIFAEDGKVEIVGIDPNATDITIKHFLRVSTGGDRIL